jgi:hypothetical protein
LARCYKSILRCMWNTGCPPHLNAHQNRGTGGKVISHSKINRVLSHRIKPSILPSAPHDDFHRRLNVSYIRGYEPVRRQCSTKCKHVNLILISLVETRADYDAQDCPTLKLARQCADLTSDNIMRDFLAAIIGYDLLRLVPA